MPATDVQCRYLLAIITDKKSFNAKLEIFFKSKNCSRGTRTSKGREGKSEFFRFTLIFNFTIKRFWLNYNETNGTLSNTSGQFLLFTLYNYLKFRFLLAHMYIYWYYVHVFNFLVYMKSAAGSLHTPRLTTTGIAIAMTTININFTNTVKHHNMFGLELNSWFCENIGIFLALQFIFLNPYRLHTDKPKNPIFICNKHFMVQLYFYTTAQDFDVL